MIDNLLYLLHIKYYYNHWYYYLSMNLRSNSLLLITIYTSLLSIKIIDLLHKFFNKK